MMGKTRKSHMNTNPKMAERKIWIPETTEFEQLFEEIAEQLSACLSERHNPPGNKIRRGMKERRYKAQQALTKYERFNVGDIREHEYYRIKGFLTVFESVPSEKLVTLAKCTNETMRLRYIALIAAEFLMDSDDENQ